MKVTAFLVTYACGDFNMLHSRPIEATDPINAIIAARAHERRLTGRCCAACTLKEVRPA